MNWVGGSRSRFLMRNDTKKQREFFAKKRLQNKLQTLGLHTSPKRESTGSRDLVSVFIVNQIATKKSKSSQPRVTHFGDVKGPKKARPGELLALPMSPCSPSRLPLARVQPLHSSTTFEKEKTFMKKRKTDSPLFKQTKLSPLLESNLSDVSAPDYQHHMRDSFSPFSVASPASVSSTELFLSHQPSQTHTSPHPWDITQSEQSQFNPYFERSGGGESDQWSGVQAGTSGHTHTPTRVTRVQFGGIATMAIESRGHDTHTASFPLCVLEENEAQESFFRIFCTDEYNSKASYDNGVMKIHLPDESASTTRTQDDSETFMSAAVDLGGPVQSIQQRNTQQEHVRNAFICKDSSQGDKYDKVSVRSDSPSYSPREGYNGSDSDDEGDDCCCQHNTHSALHTRKCAEDMPFQNSKRTGPETVGLQATPFNPIIQHHQTDFQLHCKNAENDRTVNPSGCPVPCDAGRSQKRWGCGEDHHVPVPAPAPSGNTQRPDIRSAEATTGPAPAPRTRDVATQTVPIPCPTLSNASTQCCLSLDIRHTPTQTEHHQFPMSPPDKPAVSPLSTRGQGEHGNEFKAPLRRWQGSAATQKQTHTREQHTPWQARERARTPAPKPVRFGPVPAGTPLHTWAQHRPVRQACVDVDPPPTPILGGGTFFQHAKEVGRGLPSVLGGEEHRQEGDARVAEEREEQCEQCENLTLSAAAAVSEATTGARARGAGIAEEEEKRGVKNISEEAETLQEITDILLLMKRRKQHQ